MKVTVILCTYNRCQILMKALESVAVSVMPESVEWEVLVVDNNSNDQTREVVQQICRKHPAHFRYLYEPKPGKSNALNSGIRVARGDVLAFIDDDVIVDSLWLQNLTAPFNDSKWAGVGGRILPEWDCHPPPWIPLNERGGLGPLVLFDLGTEAAPLTEPPFGTNMAFRRTIFEKYKGFRADLGPHPGSEIRGEDTEFGRRLLQAGEQFWYEPLAVVHHRVPRNRLRQKYFLRWWFDKGRSDIREFGVPKDTTLRVGGIPPYMFRRLASWTVRWIIARGPSRRFSCKLKLWSLAGEISESYRVSHTKRTDVQEMNGELLGTETLKKG